MKHIYANIFFCLIIYTTAFTGCAQEPEPDPLEIPKLPEEIKITTNGPLTETAWVSFACHVYTGPDIGDEVMDGSDSIVINSDTTTLRGSFWGGSNGKTYPSYYLENNPNYVMPTPPRIYVFISNTEYIEIIQGSHGGRDPDETSYGVIMWVRTSIENEWGGHDRVDVYFRGTEYQPDNGGGNDVDPPVGEQWLVSSLAGTSTAGYVDGTGTAARFSAPQGIAVDSNGNIYVADTGNNRIRKITAEGVVTSLAGTSTAGYADGTGTAARFSAPQGIAIDSSGNIYVADTGNNRIRKVTPAGVVTSLAGTSTAGYADGTGTAARFSAPQGIAVDSSGNIYVADTGNNRIRKVTPTGVVTTLAGTSTAGYANGTGTAARFNLPQGIAVDNNGNIYVADTGNNRIRKITPAGVVTSLAGTLAAGYANGTGTTARFSAPQGIAVDSNGNVYVADTGNNRIRKITAGGVVSSLAGTSTAGYIDGTGTAARFSAPQGIAINADGISYVTDSDNNRIRKIIKN